MTRRMPSPNWGNNERFGNHRVQITSENPHYGSGFHGGESVRVSLSNKAHLLASTSNPTGYRIYRVVKLTPQEVRNYGSQDNNRSLRYSSDGNTYEFRKPRPNNTNSTKQIKPRLISGHHPFSPFRVNSNGSVSISKGPMTITSNGSDISDTINNGTLKITATSNSNGISDTASVNLNPNTVKHITGYAIAGAVLINAAEYVIGLL